MKVLFVCDGGPSVGGGHVMRCLTLAGALTRAGARCAVLDTFAPSEIARVTDPADWPSDWVVFDSYRATLYQEAAWRSASAAGDNRRSGPPA